MVLIARERATAPKLTEETGLDRSDVHKTLQSLRRLGIVQRKDHEYWIEPDISLWRLKAEKTYPNLKPREPEPKKKPAKALVKGSYSTAQFLYDSIKTWFPGYYSKGQWRDRWAKDIDKLIRIDKQHPDLIKEVIKVMSQTPEQASGFSWRKNILSGKKLRDKFPKLRMQFYKKKTSHPIADKTENPFKNIPGWAEEWERDYGEGSQKTRTSGGAR